ncbi:MAG: hypothetical protein ABR503_14700 [Chitinophagaceae bacterium]
MKQETKLSALKLFSFAFVCTTLLSFSTSLGGDHFEIFLNKKLIFREFVHMAKGIKSFELDQSNPDATLSVYYGHCGQTGKSRSIIIKDAQDHVLKQFNFSDATGKYMSCKVKDLTNLQKKNSSNKFHLYYSSKELPKGKMLAAISFTNANVVAP